MCTEVERPLYEKAVGQEVSEIVEIPHDLRGMPRIRNWVLDRFEEEALFMLDDDLAALEERTHETVRVIQEPAEVEQIIDNTYICAKDAGARVFGFGVDHKVFHFRANLPFLLNVWTDQGWGIIGKDLRFDEHQTVKEDIDLCLLSLLRHRIVWIDNRYAWRGVKRGNVGGLSTYRTIERDRQDAEYLQHKWGRYLRLTRKQSVMGISVGVPRQQPGIPFARVQ